MSLKVTGFIIVDTDVECVQDQVIYGTLEEAVGECQEYSDPDFDAFVIVELSSGTQFKPDRAPEVKHTASQIGEEPAREEV